MSASIRASYEQLGPDEYYAQHGAEYSNPHAPYVRKCMEIALTILPNIQNALDLGCGDGLITQCLTNVDVVGCDPFMAEIYTHRTGNFCYPYSFKDIAINGFPDEIVFDTIFCSYALHLAAVSLLPQIEYQLAQVTEVLVVISPHKRPALGVFWELTLETKVEKTYLRIYRKKTNG